MFVNLWFKPILCYKIVCGD